MYYALFPRSHIHQGRLTCETNCGLQQLLIIQLLERHWTFEKCLEKSNKNSQNVFNVLIYMNRLQKCQCITSVKVIKDFPDTSKIIWKDRNYLGWNVGDTSRKWPQRITSYILHSKKKVHRLISSCPLSTEKSQVSLQLCCCFCWLVGWSVLWLSQIVEGNSRHHFQTANLPVQPGVQKDTQ